MTNEATQEDNISTDRYLTREEVARYLKIGQKAADRLIKQPDFKGYHRIGRRIIIDRDFLDKYIDSKRVI